MSGSPETDGFKIGDLLSQPCFTATVSERTYSIHKGVAAKHSGYFRGALQPCFQEGESGIVELPDAKQVPFEDFLHWLYTQKLPDYKPSEVVPRLIELYVFTDSFIVPSLGNVVTAKLVELSNTRPFFGNGIADASKITYAFKNLPDDSLFLQLLVDLAFRSHSFAIKSYGIEKMRQLPHEFLARLALKYAVNKETTYRNSVLNPDSYKRNRGKDDETKGNGELGPFAKKQKFVG